MLVPHVLLQYGSDPFQYRMEDIEGRPAFTMYIDAPPVSNVVVRLMREASWEENRPEIAGPHAAVLYFGPNNSPGRIHYGNAPEMLMWDMMVQKKESSSSRYFKSQGGKECKWKISPVRMECVSGRTTVALWEHSDPEDEFHARLTIRPAGLPIVTEIVTTLTLNRMAQALSWES
ncbi:hypothetical protein FIBSPDRAFT_740381 [Athelia psychrophila]|uniref:DUF6593 domain-containing protein n=1 Tax=Athelia psychrophila TaxID=1759441 RepID=A0A166K7J1_9AGAM|nr:hypothetical protein FIBSPDRAFT_740381 [Fibularhizoctonia sp. CBS 109695]